MNRPDRQAPVSEGQEVDVHIESVGDKGDGVARVQGFVIFVPGVKKGDWARIKIKKVNPSVAFAEKVKDIEPKEGQKTHSPPLRKKDEFEDIDLESLDEGSESFGEEE